MLSEIQFVPYAILTICWLYVTIEQMGLYNAHLLSIPVNWINESNCSLILFKNNFSVVKESIEIQYIYSCSFRQRSLLLVNINLSLPLPPSLPPY